MRLRPFALTLAALAAFAALTTAAAVSSEAKTSTTCAVPRGAKVVAASAQAFAFEVVRDDADHALYGCLRSGGKRRTLDAWTDCGCSQGDEAPPTVWLTGRVAAISRYDCPPAGAGDPCAGSITSMAISTGRRLRRLDHSAQTLDLVLRRDGAFAALLGGTVVEPGPSGESVLDPSGAAPGSLALSGDGTTLYWRNGTALRSATLT